MIINYTYYTFHDIPYAINTSNNLGPTLTYTLQNFADDIYGFIGASKTYYTIDTYTEELFKLLQVRYYNHFVFKIENADEDIRYVPQATLAPYVLQFYGKFMAIMKTTYDKYSTLLGFYAAKKTNLMDQIKNNSVSRYNDTPESGGLYADDTHTTNVTQFDSATDGASLIARLNEINDKWNSLLIDWSDEFDKIFIEED